MDGNNNQEFPDMNSNPDQLNGQTPNQSINNEAGNTYWESGSSEQSNTPVPGTPSQEAPQFNPYPGGNTYQGQQYQQILVEPPKKRSHKKSIAAAVVVVFLLALAGTAFAFQDQIKNALSLGTKSPEEYYASVEEKAVNSAVDKIYSKVKGVDFDNTAVNVSMDLSYDKGTVSSLLEGYAGMSLEDLESNIGIPLDQIGMDMTVALDDSNIYEELGLNLNQLDIVTLEIFMNSVEKELMMRVPELSPAYLSQSLDTSEFDAADLDFNSFTELSKTVYSEKTADLLKRYAKIMIEQMDNVELKKNVEVTVKDITVKGNKITVTLDEETLIDIANAVIKEAKDDKYILELLPTFNITKEQYQEALKSAAAELNDVESSDSGKIVMDVYTNSDDKIIGREFVLYVDGAKEGTLGYNCVTKGTKSKYEFFVKDADKTEIVNITGGHTAKSDALTGEANVVLNAEALDLPTEVSFTVKYEDAHSLTKGKKSFTYGKYTLSSPMMMGMELVLDYDVEDEVQKAKLSANMGSTSIVSLDMSVEYLDDYKIPVPSDTDKVVTDPASWQATMDVEKFVSDISAKLGVNVEDIIENFSSYDTIY